MSKILYIIGTSILAASVTHASVIVTAESDKISVHVGDRINVTVRATRSDSPDEPTPSHAGLQLGPEWEAGAQTAESERPDSTGRIKTWHFELVALSETLSTITPVVILAAPPPDAPQLATNRVLGPPLSVTIMPPKVRPWWLLHPRTIAVIAGLATTAFVIVRAIRRRKQNCPRPSLTPYQEATAMMEDVHANCREDRAPRFFADVERVLSGYLSRRMGRSLGSATASEMAAMASRHVSDAPTIADLQAILRRCTTARFSGAKMDFRMLTETEEMTRSILERLDGMWVTDTPSTAHGEQGRTETSAGADRS